jgi:hypothetical protein
MERTLQDRPWACILPQVWSGAVSYCKEKSTGTMSLDIHSSKSIKMGRAGTEVGAILWRWISTNRTERNIIWNSNAITRIHNQALFLYHWERTERYLRRCNPLLGFRKTFLSLNKISRLKFVVQRNSFPLLGIKTWFTVRSHWATPSPNFRLYKKKVTRKVFSLRVIRYMNERRHSSTHS